MEYFKLDGIPYDACIEPYMDQVSVQWVLVKKNLQEAKAPVVEFIGRLEHHASFRRYVMQLALSY